MWRCSWIGLCSDTTTMATVRWAQSLLDAINFIGTGILAWRRVGKCRRKWIHYVECRYNFIGFYLCTNGIIAYISRHILNFFSSSITHTHTCVPIPLSLWCGHTMLLRWPCTNTAHFLSPKQPFANVRMQRRRHKLKFYDSLEQNCRNSSHLCGPKTE